MKKSQPVERRVGGVVGLGQETTTGSWYKSSYSSDGACCVEVMLDGGQIHVRDSKFRRDPGNAFAAEPMLAYTPAEWEAFVAGVKAGEFDLG
ncbi:MAG: DUF397 domain-containing protein [bacterium]|nr:DUF397 domain-containing protein [bacterium]